MSRYKRRSHEDPAQAAGRPGRFWRSLGRDDRLPIDPELSPDDPGEPSVAHQPSRSVLHRRDPRVLAAIAAGGFIGATGRYGVGLAWPTAAGAFPAATFTINTSGAFALGFLLTVILERVVTWRWRWRYLQAFACIGVLGAWTTMSTLATEADVLLKDGYVTQAVAYMSATLIAGLCATATGIALGRRGATPQ